MSVPVYQVDAFTSEPFGGNPAAVCLLDREPPVPWMHNVAAEMNLSETAFVVLGEPRFGLRWFTPTREVDLCGHATLASAHVLWEQGHLERGEAAQFDTRSGEVGAERDDEGWIWLDFPIEPAEELEAPDGLAEALGARPSRVARNRLDYLVEFATETELLALHPDHQKVAALDDERCVIATAPADDPDVDYACRYFAPSFGIPEDPVTGSIQCALGPWWADRLGKKELVGVQRSERGGRLLVRPGKERVVIGGQAVMVLVGELTTPPG